MTKTNNAHTAAYAAGRAVSTLRTSCFSPALLTVHTIATAAKNARNAGIDTPSENKDPATVPKLNTQNTEPILAKVVGTSA
ncbi:unknown [Clostridium sp. CAG:448]|nr:unknown [Clostridium sp. CAG:448]